ncbi:MAG: endonuclease III [Deltaproteobacteria bacterium]|nr:endonuclease III [Deltaproteobacteria bacterium]
MTPKDIPAAIKILKQEYRKFKTPYVTEVAAKSRKDPFKALISCIISLRTKDETTRTASERLFAIASTPDEMSRLSPKTVEKAVYPAGFYRVKAKNIIGLSKAIVRDFAGKPPDTIEGLLTLKGVGRKTANLVVTMGYGNPGICVDTHVHRITNRWGFVGTRGPEETEFELREKLPQRYWIIINDLLVAYGQNICKPVSPLCSGCRLYKLCERRGVGASR